jgi:hypothetical protein
VSERFLDEASEQTILDALEKVEANATIAGAEARMAPEQSQAFRSLMAKINLTVREARLELRTLTGGYKHTEKTLDDLRGSGFKV